RSRTRRKKSPRTPCSGLRIRITMNVGGGTSIVSRMEATTSSARKVPMIHYSCDCCKRVLDPEDLRYVVKMEVYAAFDPSAMSEMDDDRDHLQEIQDILQRSEDA